VVQYRAAFLEIGHGEGPADRFGYPICKAVRVSDTFPFHELDLLLLKRDLVQGFHSDVSLH